MVDLHQGKREADKALSEGRPEEALAIADGVLRDHGWDQSVAYARAIALFRLGDFSDAERAFDEVVAHDPSHALAVYYIGLCAERLGRHDDAVGRYRAAYRLRRDLTEARDKLEQYGVRLQSERSAGASDEPRMTEFDLPPTRESVEEYRRRRTQKERAELSVWWHSKPWPLKALIVLFLIVWASFMLVWAAVFFGGAL